MRQGDIPAVVAISDAVHGRFTENAEVFGERLALYPQGCLIFEREGKVQGYLISHPWQRRSSVPLGALVGAIPDGADTYYVHDVALLPETRGLGAGKRAVDLCAGRAVAAGYEAMSLVAVNGADRFWAAQGFAPVEVEGLAQMLQSYGPDTVFMERPV